MQTEVPTGQQTVMSLDEVRREIDAIDDGMIELLARRFRLVDHVKALKQTGGSAASPLRPAREATVLRRLLANGGAAGINPELLVRLWPAIFCDASLRQQPVTIHVSKRLSQTIGNRLRIRDYFPLMQVEECRDESEALIQIDAVPTDICIVECDAPWIAPLIQGKGGKARVLASLPVLGESPEPNLLVIGHTLSEATLHDETLVLTQGGLPREFSLKPLWEVKNGDYRLSALPGFLSEKENPLMGLMRANGKIGLKVIGRYPSAMKLT
jgi:chorismate mutase / prephenate dehydratase